MSRILWCGGSHLANAYNLIRHIFSSFENSFYVTAAPLNRDWSANGGRYSVKGSVIGGNAAEPSVFHDLNQFSLIVFVGQYVQPTRFMRDGQPLSRAVLDSMFPAESFLINLPGGIYNEPISLFPEIASGRCVLICDPIPVHGIPKDNVVFFLNKVREFCGARNIHFEMQPEKTLDDNFSTRAEYLRGDADLMHFNDKFWMMCLSEVFGKVRNLIGD